MDLNIVNCASDVVDISSKYGVYADVVVSEVRDVSMKQRVLRPEDVSESLNVCIGLRVIKDHRLACVSTSVGRDFCSTDSIKCLVERAIAIAEKSPFSVYVKEIEDSFANLGRNSSGLSKKSLDLEIFDSRAVKVSEMQSLVRTTEEHLLNYDNRVFNSEGVCSACSDVSTAIAATNGLIDHYRKTAWSIHATALAKHGEHMELAYDYWVACRFDDILNRAAAVGKQSADKAVKKLGSKKIHSTKANVVFDRIVASDLLKSFASMIEGTSVANNTSCMAGSLGKNIFPKDINVIDDPFMPGKVGSRPFDGEGFVGDKLKIVDEGVLQCFLLDFHTASMLSCNTNARAVRLSSGAVVQGATNLFIAPASAGNGGSNAISVQELFSQIGTGLYVTELFGHGINPVTGDLSYGVCGFWIEGGELTYPVNEVTVSDNICEMFKRITIANDLLHNGSINSPTFLVPDMAIAGI